MTIRMQSTLEIRSGEMENFVTAMNMAVPVMEEFGWKLVQAFAQFSGQLGTVVDVWELKNAGEYQRGMEFLVSHPIYPEFIKLINAAVQKETVVLGFPVPYCKRTSN